MVENKLLRLARVYPSVVVEYEDGTKTTISLEWYEQNSQSVKLLGYALIYIYKDGLKEEEHFENYEDMLKELQRVYELLQKLKK